MGARRVLVGVCGFPEARVRLYRDLDLVEVQRTFYQPPAPETAARWRAEAPPGFVFTLKAWQLVTHEPASPTYRRLRERLPPRALAECGGLRWNRTTRMAWARTLEVAAALEARAVVVQTPARFGPTAANLRRLRRFFTEAPRAGLRMVFEPRGAGWEDALLRALAAELDLVIAVDPFLRPPPARRGLRYLRLHGRPAYRYRYRYTDEDLRALAAIVGGGPACVLFNNLHMAGDARRFRALLSAG